MCDSYHVDSLCQTFSVRPVGERPNKFELVGATPAGHSRTSRVGCLGVVGRRMQTLEHMYNLVLGAWELIPLVLPLGFWFSSGVSKSELPKPLLKWLALRMVMQHVLALDLHYE